MNEWIVSYLCFEKDIKAKMDIMKEHYEYCRDLKLKHREIGDSVMVPLRNT